MSVPFPVSLSLSRFPLTPLSSCSIVHSVLLLYSFLLVPADILGPRLTLAFWWPASAPGCPLTACSWRKRGEGAARTGGGRGEEPRRADVNKRTGRREVRTRGPERRNVEWKEERQLCGCEETETSPEILDILVTTWDEGRQCDKCNFVIAEILVTGE